MSEVRCKLYWRLEDTVWWDLFVICGISFYYFVQDIIMPLLRKLL
jgi:hypothetical protein